MILTEVVVEHTSPRFEKSHEKMVSKLDDILQLVITVLSKYAYTDLMDANVNCIVKKTGDVRIT